MNDLNNPIVATPVHPKKYTETAEELKARMSTAMKQVFDKYQIDGTYADEGINKNLDTWYTNKTYLRNLFRQSPLWDDENQAIVVDRTVTIKCSADTMRSTYSNLFDGLDYNLNLSNDSRTLLKNIAYQLEDVYLNCGKLNSAIIADIVRDSDNIRKHISSAMRDGVSITRIVNKICSELVLADGSVFDATTYNSNGWSYQAIYAKFSDACHDREAAERVTISIHPCDFLLMSNGNSWSSCHFINSNGIFHENASTSYHGAYKAGCLSYMLDEPSFIVSTLPAKASEPYYDVPKQSRICCQYTNGILVCGKRYPNNSNDARADIRNFIEGIIAGVEGQPHRWKVSHNVDRIADFVTTGCNSLHYRDYEYDAQHPAIAALKSMVEFDFDAPAKLTIGHESYCVHCGTRLRDASKIECSKHDHIVRCAHCGKVITSGVESFTYDGDTYCGDCGVMCDYHGVLEPKTIACHDIGDGRMVCDDAIKYYAACAKCGTMHKLVDMKRGVDGNMYCIEHFDELFETCPDCGALKFRGKECRVCAMLGDYKGAMHKPQKGDIKAGDYVVIADDISHNPFHSVAAMVATNPGTVRLVVETSDDNLVIRIEDVEPTHTYHWAYSMNEIAYVVDPDVGSVLVGQKVL